MIARRGQHSQRLPGHALYMYKMMVVIQLQGYTKCKQKYKGGNLKNPMTRWFAGNGFDCL